MGMVGLFAVIAMMFIFKGCQLVNVEMQQTSRIITTSARNPNTEGIELQGSERTQGKTNTADVNPVDDPSGAEK